MIRMRRDEGGLASSMVAFSVAGLLFVASVAGVLYISRTSSTSPAVADPQTAASLQGKANALASVVLDSPGYASNGQDWAPTNNWGGPATTANGITRLGLLDINTQSSLNFTKLQNLRRAPYDASSSDGYVNYPEARAALGLDGADLDFHIRAYPTLPNVAQLLKTGWRDPNLHVTYIGDIDVTRNKQHQPPADPAQGLTVTNPTCSVSPLHPSDYRIASQVTNGGTAATQFSALFTYTLGGASSSSSQNTETYLVAPGATVTISVDVPSITYTQSGGNGNGNGNSQTITLDCTVNSTLKVDVGDPSTVHVLRSVTLGSAVTGATHVSRDPVLDSFKPYFTNPTGVTSGCPDPVKVAWSMPHAAIGDKLALKVVDSNTGNQVSPTTGYTTWTVPDNGRTGNNRAPVTTGTVTVGCLVAGNYLATLYYYTAANPSSTDLQVVESLYVATAAPSPYTPPGQEVETGPNVYTSTAWATAETGFLETLVEPFCPYDFDSQTQSPMSPAPSYSARCGFKSVQTQYGDVFPDSKDIMNNDLPARLLDAHGLPRYDLVNVLVAGSNIDQTAMTSAAAKQAIADWVLGGGLLIVFGSTDQNVNWLEPIFHAAIRSSSGGIAVPDPSHPVLHTADELDYALYDNRDRVWNFNGQTAQDAATLFTNIVVQGTDPVTTESNPGAMGDGSVILTTWTPYDVYDGAKDSASTSSEGLKLVNNLLMQGYRDLYLDYGPRLPAGVNVVPAMRMVQVVHPQFTQPIELSVIFYVF